MVLQLKIFCFHKDEPVDDETGYPPSYEMRPDPITESEISLVCPNCGNEVFVTFEAIRTSDEI